MKMFFALFLASRAFSADAIPDTHMRALSHEVNALQNVLFSAGDFQASTQASTIENSLEVLTNHLQKLEKGTFGEDPALKANLSLLSLQVAEARQSFRAGQKAYSRYMLQNGLQLCIACHTRTKSMDFILPAAELKNASSIERAEFFFATRQFEKGQEAFSGALKDPAARLRPSTLRAALLSLAAYYSRVKQDPEAGRKFFADLAKQGRFSRDQKKELAAWSRDFAAWGREKPPAASRLTEGEWLKAAQGFLREEETASDVRRLRATALLHRVLESPAAKAPQKGEALLALGQAHQQLNYPVSFRLGELYFKACIKEVPKTSTARQCYEALQAAVHESGGNEVELLQLRKQVF